MNDLNNYILSCESTVDIPYLELEKRNINVINYKYTINNQEYIDDMDNDSLNEFYKQLEEGSIPKTSQINTFDYYNYFKRLLQTGNNIFHITFGTGMTNSYNNAIQARNDLINEFPNQNIILNDSLCSSTGYGILVLKAYEMMKEENNITDVVSKINDLKVRIHHQFFTSDMKYYKRTGRVSGATAFIASALRICPIMRLNKEGKIIAYNKAFGKGMAIKRTIDEMERHCINGLDYNDVCYICHSNALDDALELRNKLEAKFSNLKNKIEICNIGKIITSHSGPGTVAVFFIGDIRK